jgi:hypothetical protein
MRYQALLVFATVCVGLSSGASDNHAAPFKHVAVFSIDGLHGSDVHKYVAKRPGSTIAKLLATGFEYTNAFTSAPSDSFPGSLNPFTGASPRTTGVWYDDTFDRAFFAPGSDCTGPPGAEGVLFFGILAALCFLPLLTVVYAETVDFDFNQLFSGGINPDNLPRAIVDGTCTSVFPHSRLRVNTVFEVVRSHGLETAYTDKHPSYDIMRGPSGTGLSTGYFPEIASFPVEIDLTIAYDQLHVNAFLDWLDGKVPVNSTGSLKETPALFGGNFQAGVSCIFSPLIIRQSLTYEQSRLARRRQVTLLGA